MEESIREEISALAARLSRDEQPEDLGSLLQQLRLLEEKVILYQYFQFRESGESAAKSSVSASAVNRELEAALEAAERSRAEAETRLEAARKVFEGQNTPAEEPKKEKPEAEAPVRPSREPKEQAAAEKTPKEAPREAPAQRQRTLHQHLGSGQIKLGLNDRMAFSKHLFDGSQEDLSRVISQINTFDSFSEAEGFIEEMVKPDYNWKEKEEYEERFLALVKARFGEE